MKKNVLIVVLAVSLAAALSVPRAGCESALPVPSAGTPKTGLTPITAPITLISPNGSETFRQGDVITIKWTGGSGVVKVGLVAGTFGSPGDDGRVLGWISVDASPNSQITWDGKLIYGLTMKASWDALRDYSGPFKIIVVSEDDKGSLQLGGNIDTSDAPFNLLPK